MNMKDFEIDELETDLGIYVVIRHNRMPIASAFLHFRDDHAEIEGLIVDEAYRGQGLASDIINEMVEIASADKDEIYLTCKPESRMSDIARSAGFERYEKWIARIGE